MKGSLPYQGNELELFRHAKNWKKYFSNIISPHIRGKVLEVGAGLGVNTGFLNDINIPDWVLLEPDEKMAQLLFDKILQKELPGNCRMILGTTEDVLEKFDTVIYIDVLEHIEDDRQELQRAAALLNENGKIIVLSPAFPFLFSPFDKAIGHYRRYTRKKLIELTPMGMRINSCRYYDTIGFFAAAANRIMLRQSYPTTQQIALWDNFMIPVSRLNDRLSFHLFGKTIIAVWQKI